MADSEIGKITVYKDKDGDDVLKIYGKVQTDVELLTEAQTFAEAINELFQSGGEGGDEWIPPEDWPAVPEPEEYEINLLVLVLSSGSGISIHITRPEDANTGNGALSVDWGDGTSQSWTGNEEYSERWQVLYHRYETSGRYVIRALTTNQSCFLQRLYGNVLIAKLGTKIVLNNVKATGQTYYDQIAFKDKPYLHWVKFSGDLPVKECFYGCFRLRRIDNRDPINNLPAFCFYNCLSLKNFDFTQVEQIGEKAIYSTGFEEISLAQITEIPSGSFQNNYNLRKITAQNCTAVGDLAFYNCRSLVEANFADECDYGEECFSCCYSMTVRPDGTDFSDYY